MNATVTKHRDSLLHSLPISHLLLVYSCMERKRGLPRNAMRATGIFQKVEAQDVTRPAQVSKKDR